MDLAFLLRGLAIGFSIAAPVGPIGVLCIRRTLAHGRLVGLLSGLGAASADAVYGCVAAFGLTSVSAFLISHQTLLRTVGGAFLIYLGARTFRTPPAEDAGGKNGKGLAGAYASTFLLTLANPITILSFAAIFAGLGIGATEPDYGSAAWLVLGVFLGSAAWWVILSTGVGVSRERFRASGLRWANRGAGVVLFAFGAAALASLAR
jgi:threonine/homoserine/homoserine lactone efflux protein